jgi:hypothetical protein
VIEETVKTLVFDIITTMAMEGDEDAKNKEHVDDRISELEMKISSENTTKKKVNRFNFHII